MIGYRSSKNKKKLNMNINGNAGFNNLFKQG
jgi:hypothetical protein